ncbi:MAG: T9SS type A sorting domain-containing protein [Bacteroidales bacterium]|nr:T9SS type A sorting domain-containing protein [Bacteroidales bacterium]
MRRKILTIILILLIAQMTWAQKCRKASPLSFRLCPDTEAANFVLPAPDVDALTQEDKANESFFKAQRCAVAVPAEADFFDYAKHVSLSDYDVYLLKISIPYAQALGFSSDDFFLPEGSEFFIYNSDKTKILGAYTSENNTYNGIFATEYVYGDEMILEYIQPKGNQHAARIKMSDFVYFYRDVIHFEDYAEEQDGFVKKEFKASGSCNVNVNCSEGSNYQNVKRSVMRIQVKAGYSYYWCTGTLLNTTDNSKIPYILTAAHCVQYLSNSDDYNYFVFFFNYEAQGCQTPNSSPSYTSHTGCTKLALESSYGDNGSDYLLLRLTDDLTAADNPYFAGWSRTSNPPSNGVGIHHPSGDIKKISTFTSKPSSSEYYTSTHWRVFWSSTSNGFGIVEGGSSGSGLFAPDGKLLGTLTGGFSSCSATNSDKKDWYGRFSKQFPYFSEWLDPQSTNVDENEGLDFSQTVMEIKATENQTDFNLYPTLTSGELNLTFSLAKEDMRAEVLDINGYILMSESITKGERSLSLDISSFKSGIYFVRLVGKEQSETKKVIKQ